MNFVPDSNLDQRAITKTLYPMYPICSIPGIAEAKEYEDLKTQLSQLP